MHNKQIPFVLVTLFIAAPLSAQQTVVVPDISVTNEHPITNEITVEVMSDSIRDARIADAIDNLAATIAAQGCDQCAGTSTTVRVGQGALVLATFFVGWQLKRIADRAPDIHNDGDVNVTVPPREHDRGERE